MKEREQIKLEALSVPLNETIYAYCPFCGAKHEQKLSITRIEQGLLYNCYRASCGKKGFIPSVPSAYLKEQAPEKKSKAVAFTKQLHPIPAVLQAWLTGKYRLSSYLFPLLGWKFIRKGNRLACPIRDVNGKSTGWATKRMPVLDGSEGVPDDGPKWIVYPATDDALVHFAQTPTKKEAVIVEDIISAEVLSEVYGIDAVALLGTNMSTEQAMIIREYYPNAIIMLDPDASKKAFKIFRNYKLSFTNLRVIVPPEDPKDMKPEQIKEMLLSG